MLRLNILQAGRPAPYVLQCVSFLFAGRAAGTLGDEDLLRSLLEAARARDVPPSDEMFVLCNWLMNPAAGASRLAWLTAGDAHWLLQLAPWNDEAARFLASKGHQERPSGWLRRSDLSQR